MHKKTKKQKTTKTKQKRKKEKKKRKKKQKRKERRRKKKKKKSNSERSIWKGCSMNHFPAKRFVLLVLTPQNLKCLKRKLS